MKFKLLLAGFLLFSFQNFFAQETVIDSVQQKQMQIEKEKALEKERLEQQLQQEKAALKEEKEREKTENLKIKKL